MNWHYSENGQPVGPVNDEQLAELARTGKINPETLVWHEGLADWQPYRQANGPQEPGAAASPPIAALGQSPEAVCNECGKLFPQDEMIRHGNAWICSGCKPVFMQKLSEGAAISTGELNYARISSRFAAMILDGLIMMAVNIGVGIIAGLSAAQAAGVEPKGAIALQLVLLAVQMGFAIGYETFFIGKYGATPGKMACKIKVVTAEGGRVSYARALGRYFGKLLSSFTLMIGYLMALFDNPQKRALHDRICNTRVICK